MTDPLLEEQDLPKSPARRDYALGPEDHQDDERRAKVDELVLGLVVGERTDLEVLR